MQIKKKKKLTSLKSKTELRKISNAKLVPLIVLNLMYGSSLCFIKILNCFVQKATLCKI